MIRILILILSAILLAGIGTFLFSQDTLIVGEAFGGKFEIPAGGAVFVLLVGAIILVLATSVSKDLIAFPAKVKAQREGARRERGMAALTRGLEAVAVGAAGDAQHHARVAQRNLSDSSLTRLLTAQAAQLAGDDLIAEQSFSAMLEAPETEFLGLRGLYAKAIRQDDKDAARGYAQRAFKLRPNAEWAFRSVFELSLDRGAWGQARADLSTAQKNKIIDVAAARRAEAALLTADAFTASASDDAKTALSECEQALKLAPSLAPAAVLAARLYHHGNQKSKAAKVLETAFTDEPHIAIVGAYFNLYADEKEQKRAEKMQRLADRHPSARAAKIALARRALLLDDAQGAIDILEPLLSEQATARECTLMADAVTAVYGADHATPWLERAAAAPRDPTPGADGSFAFTRNGWARLIKEYMDFGRLAPPPLEDAPIGLPAEELRLLLTPPPPAEPDVVDDDDPAEAAEQLDSDEEQNADQSASDTDAPADALTDDQRDLAAKAAIGELKVEAARSVS